MQSLMYLSLLNLVDTWIFRPISLSTSNLKSCFSDVLSDLSYYSGLLKVCFSIITKVVFICIIISLYLNCMV